MTTTAPTTDARAERRTGVWYDLSINTTPADGYPNPVYYFDVTSKLRDAIPADVTAGVLHIFIPHTTCTIIFNSGVDGTTLHDIRLLIEESVPTTRPFVHLHDGPQDASAHVRCLFGTQSLQLPIIDGALGIGLAQGVYLLEFDGPRDRRVQYAVQSFG